MNKKALYESIINSINKNLPKLINESIYNDNDEDDSIIGGDDTDEDEDFEEGWNEDRLEEVSDVLDDLYNLQYEIKNCRKGVYTHCDNYESLSNYIMYLAERLKEAAEEL